MTELRQFRFVAFAEGLSFVLLLFVAMPLKYLAGMPLAVRIVGSVHGALFFLYVFALLRVAASRSWDVKRTVHGFVSSLYPFGTFVFDRTLRSEMLVAASEPSES